MVGATKRIPEEESTLQQQKGCADSRRAQSRRFRTISGRYRLRLCHFLRAILEQTLLNKHSEVAMLLADLLSVISVGVE